MKSVNVYEWGGRKQAEEAGVVIVMRGTPLGNPHVMHSEAERAKVIEEYRVWLWGEMKKGNGVVLKELKTLKEGDLVGCCCKPRACHADVVIAAARWLAKQEGGVK